MTIDPALVYAIRSVRYDSRRWGTILSVGDLDPALAGQYALWVPGDTGYGPLYVGEWSALEAQYLSRPLPLARPVETKASRTAAILAGLNL